MRVRLRNEMRVPYSITRRYLCIKDQRLFFYDRDEDVVTDFLKLFPLARVYISRRCNQRGSVYMVDPYAMGLAILCFRLCLFLLALFL